MKNIKITLSSCLGIACALCQAQQIYPYTSAYPPMSYGNNFYYQLIALLAGGHIEEVATISDTDTLYANSLSQGTPVVNYKVYISAAINSGIVTNQNFVLQGAVGSLIEDIKTPSHFQSQPGLLVFKDYYTFTDQGSIAVDSPDATSVEVDEVEGPGKGN